MTPSLGIAQAAITRSAAELENGNPESAATILRLAMEQGPWPPEVIDVIQHNLCGALAQIATSALNTTNPQDAHAPVIEALSIPAPSSGNQQMLRHRAEFFHGLGLAFFKRYQFAQALQCQRRAIALYPCPSYSNNLVNTLAILKQPGLLSDYADALPLSDLAPHLLIACQPKSGSTFLKNLLCEVTGFRDLFLFHASGQNEQDLFYPTLLEFASTPTVTQQHCRASAANLQILQAFGIKVVVLTRNLADVVVSLRDFYNSGAVFGTFFNPEEWKNLTPDEQTNRIIDHIIPWHLQFIASWRQADLEHSVPILWLQYEEWTNQPIQTVKQILKFYGITAPDEKIKNAVCKLTLDPSKNRFNQGRSGRGRENLNSNQLRRLEQLAAAFPNTKITIT